MLEPLFIGEPNTVFVEIEDVTNATVTFTLKDADGAVIGTAEDVSMTYVADRTRYEGAISATNAALLEESDPDDADTWYYVWIEATGYTLRRLERMAKYREEA